MKLKETPFLDIQISEPIITREDKPDGTIYFRTEEKLPIHPTKVTERLIKWAKETPENTFIAEKDSNGDWKKMNYGEAFEKAQIIGQYLINKGVSAEKPVVILSSNSIEQAQVILATLHIGIPFSPISPAYSIKSVDFAKLKYCIELLTPGVIFVQDGTAFGNALKAACEGIPVFTVSNPLPGQDVLEEVLKTEVTEEVEKFHNNIRPETVAKVLFTSGSTGMPKGVINTHRNITTNNAQTVHTFPFMDNGGFHLIDWLPWNHTFGGNNNFGMALYTGGSLYIDNGSATPKGIKETVKNIREVAPTIYYNVPVGFEELLPYLKEDKELCKFFFSRLKMFFYAGASMPQHVWDELEQIAFDTTGKRLFIGTGLGMTETSPSAMFNIKMGSSPGKLGVPVPELEVKLVPDDDKYEARFKGANVTPGYWRNPEATAKAFDEDGFYKTGDALKVIDDNDNSKGMVFNGRIAENFKLNSGTWVNVGGLRAKLVAAANGLLIDAVITGHDKDYLGAIAIMEINNCRKISGLAESDSVKEIVNHPMVLIELQNILNKLGDQNTGSSTCIRKLVVADFELSIDKGEITDKGSINQRAVLKHRNEIVEALYSGAEIENVLLNYNRK